MEAVQGSMVKHCMRVQYADALWSTGVPLVVDCSETTAICHPCQTVMLLLPMTITHPDCLLQACSPRYTYILSKLAMPLPGLQ